MMKTRFLTTALVLFACTSLGAAAAPVVPIKDRPLYWGIGYSWAEYGQEGTSEVASMGAFAGRLGYQLSDMFAVETRYVQGFREDNIGAVQVDFNQVYGAYAKMNILTDINFSPYAMFGYSEGEVTFNSTTVLKESDYSYALGVEFCRHYHSVCAHLEHMTYVSLDNFELTTLTFGFKVVF